MNDVLEGMLETALYAEDLDKVEAFYEGVLGLSKISRSGNRHVFFRCGPGVLLISGENLDAIAARLMSEGVAIESEVTWPQGGRSIYFRDPDGNSLECAEARIWGIE